MVLRFESGYSGDIIKLSLKDEYELILIHFEMTRYTATDLVNALKDEETNVTVPIQDWILHILKEDNVISICVGDKSPYLTHKILLTNTQALDLASTLQMMIIASESEGRPKDNMSKLDDTLNSEWTPEKEKEMFGRDDGDDLDGDDPADKWKKGK